MISAADSDAAFPEIQCYATCVTLKQQTTNNKQQTTNNKQQTTNNKQQTTNNKQQLRSTAGEFKPFG
ncbi:hypothetical protein [Rhodopirellula baltica]|uniref:hypothetical protein n=1 Tax=Rhodopirellula baltica TaxID=265606 RepID=UPI000567E1D4|nr:hypothetical protein [Rhodopirellula baltica]